MFGITGAHIVAISALLFSACSGLTLIYAVNHLDAPAPPAAQPDRHADRQVA